MTTLLKNCIAIEVNKKDRAGLVEQLMDALDDEEGDAAEDDNADDGEGLADGQKELEDERDRLLGLLDDPAQDSD